MSNFLTTIGGEEVIFSLLESSIPKIKNFIIEELERHEKKYNPKGHIMFNIFLKTPELLTINLIEKNYTGEGENTIIQNTVIAEMITVNRIIAPSFFAEMDKIQEAFKNKIDLSLEIVKYEKNGRIFLVVAMTEQEKNGICKAPIKIVTLDNFLKKIISRDEK